MKLKYQYIGVFLLNLCWVWQASAQDPAVLHFKNNGYNSYFDLGIDLKDDLLDQGMPGEATLEFWIKSEQSANEWILTDMTSDDAHFKLWVENENQLKIKVNNNISAIDLRGEVEAGVWRHVALVLSSDASLLEVYFQGEKRGQFAVDFSMNFSHSLYFMKESSEEIFLTEVRAWSQRRTPDEVADNQWKVYLSKSDSDLDALKLKNLEVVYGTADIIASTPAYIPEVAHVQWSNMLTDQTITASAKNVSDYNDTSLLEIRTDAGHPLLDLDEILLEVSKGEFDDHILLTWPHVEGIDEYYVYRTEAGGSPSHYNNEILSASNLNVSENVTFTDDNILPNQVYEYEIKGFKSDDEVFEINGADRGFIFPNGTVNGNIRTEQKIFVEDVEVLVAADVLPGYAVEFASNTAPIEVKGVEDFRYLTGFTVEFWHANTGNGTSNVFELGGASIAVSPGGVSVTNGNGSAYVSTDTLSNDSDWHHYAVVFGASEGVIYQDGALKAKQSTAFAIDLGTATSFAFNAGTTAAYQMDELRIWETERTYEEVVKRSNHIIKGTEEGLLMYYRFDIADEKYIYNQAADNKGSFAGECAAALNWVTQPSALVYGTFTDESGNYIHSYINIGLSTDFVSFTVTPAKPNHTFSPESRGVDLKRSLTKSDHSTTADFTDISALPLAGKVLYNVEDTLYPVPAGQQFVLDNASTPITGDDSGLQTDNSGVFSIGAPLGKHYLEVYNPTQSTSYSDQSLAFDGVDDYAISESNINLEQDGTWSGWIKRGTFEGTIPAEQTVMQLGNVRLVLENNETLTLKTGDTEVLTSSDQLTDEWTFFAFTYKASTRLFSLYAEAGENNLSTYNQSTANTSGSMNGKMVLGAYKDADISEFLKGNLYLIEYRDALYSSTEVANLYAGTYSEEDESRLEISYAFTEKEENTLRTVSLRPNAQKYALKLENGTVFDDQNFHTYTRETKYDYRATGALVDPEDDSQFYFNVVAPVTGLEIYNDTRYGFVGNIVIPCGCNVGAWDIRIKRTDLSSSDYIVEYTGTEAEALFNDNFTVFTIDGLMPGKYSITLTNQEDVTVILSSPSVDLTKGWDTYEFEHRRTPGMDAEIIAKVGDAEQVVEEEGVSKIEASTSPLEASDYCDDKYILEQAGAYVVALAVYEGYYDDNGADTKCFTEGVEYAFSSEWPGNILATNFTDNIGAGQDTIVVQAGEPEFIAPFTRTFNLTATTPGNSTVEGSMVAYITGSKQYNKDFALEAPPNIMAVVHDPPGDGSSATLSEKTSFSFNETVTHSGGAEFAFDFSTGTDVEHYTGYFVGLGGGNIGMTKIVDSEAKARLNITENFKFGSSETKSYEVSLNEAVSTSGSGTLPGIKSDVYIGYSPVINFGTGKTLTMGDDGCSPTLDETVTILNTDRTPFFAVTHQHIKDVLITNLETLYL